MSQDLIRSAILTLFATLPPEFIPVVRENNPWTQPKNTTWGRLSIQPIDAFNGSIGSNHLRYLGVVYLQIFAPENAGTKTCRDAADTLATIFDNVTLTPEAGFSIEFQRVGLKTVGKTADGLFQMNAWVEYRADKFL